MEKIIIIAKESDIRVYKNPNIAKKYLKKYFDEFTDKAYTDHDYASIDSFVDKLDTTENTIEFLVEDNYDLSPVVFTGKTYLL
ncbi:hypothetical protein ACNGDX_09435 [Campylobacter coli]|nr:hypothetical protein [Campylobacter coli]EEY3096704.1 hypothetical protein [Campylobacter coli]EGD0127546.1 hypothetical protein [Campylobacter coli]BEJ69060.1 hypothetical protein B10307_20110 [Campylobacter coli]HDV6547056.1 hypothetical protein [Campylobacter coli]HED4393235.1 hypothetical protein [Campylobacter coli]